MQDPELRMRLTSKGILDASGEFDPSTLQDPEQLAELIKSTSKELMHAVGRARATYENLAKKIIEKDPEVNMEPVQKARKLQRKKQKAHTDADGDIVLQDESEDEVVSSFGNAYEDACNKEYDDTITEMGKRGQMLLDIMKWPNELKMTKLGHATQDCVRCATDISYAEEMKDADKKICERRAHVIADIKLQKQEP